MYVRVDAHPQKPHRISSSSHSTLLFFGGHAPAFNGDNYQGAIAALDPINEHFNAHKPTTFFKKDYDPNIDHIPPEQPRRRQFYTAIGYALSSHGARYLLNMLDEFGFSPRSSSDIMLIKLMDLFDNVYALRPNLVVLPDTAFNSHKNYDTDIWGSTLSVPGSMHNP